MSRGQYEILAYEETPLGVLCLRRRELLSRPGQIVTEITINGEFLMSSYNTASEEALAGRALDLHGGPALRVMVGGLGLGYTSREVLQSDRVAELEVVEYLPAVIGWLEKDLFPVAETLRNDERFRVVSGDVYERLLAPPASGESGFDLILIDVDHSPDERLDEASARFYTASGIRAAARHLRPDGILGVWSYASSSPFATAMHEVFDDVHVEAVEFTNDLIDTEETDWLFFGRGL